MAPTPAPVPPPAAGVISIPPAATTAAGRRPIPARWTPPAPVPASASRAVVLLTHGASGDATSGNLPAYASAFSAAGLGCLAFAARGALAPRAAAFRAAAAWARAAAGARAVLLAGHSMGSRAACVAVNAWSEDLPPLAGLVLFSFPLHPPGRPAAATGADRGGLLAALPPDLPVLVVRGDRDPFATAAPWGVALGGAAAGVEAHTVVGGDHGLKVKGGGEDAPAAAAAAAAAWAAGVVGRRGGGDGGAPAKKRRRWRET